jgi:hypothetical protein
MADRRSGLGLGLGLDRLGRWIGWADCYRGSVKTDPDDPHRAGELPLRGYSIHGVRDRADIADRLAFWCEDTGRSDEAREWKRQAGSTRSAAVHRHPSAGNRARRHGQVPSQQSSMHAIGASWRVSAFSGLARNQLGNQRELHLPGPSPDRLLRGGGQDSRPVPSRVAYGK